MLLRSAVTVSSLSPRNSCFIVMRTGSTQLHNVVVVDWAFAKCEYLACALEAMLCGLLCMP